MLNSPRASKGYSWNANQCLVEGLGRVNVRKYLFVSLLTLLFTQPLPIIPSHNFTLKYETINRQYPLTGQGNWLSMTKRRQKP